MLFSCIYFVHVSDNCILGDLLLTGCKFVQILKRLTLYLFGSQEGKILYILICHHKNNINAILIQSVLRLFGTDLFTDLASPQQEKITSCVHLCSHVNRFEALVFKVTVWH